MSPVVYPDANAGPGGSGWVQSQAVVVELEATEYVPKGMIGYKQQTVLLFRYYEGLKRNNSTQIYLKCMTKPESDIA